MWTCLPSLEAFLKHVDFFRQILKPKRRNCVDLQQAGLGMLNLSGVWEKVEAFEAVDCAAPGLGILGGRPRRRHA